MHIKAILAPMANVTAWMGGELGTDDRFGAEGALLERPRLLSSRYRQRRGKGDPYVMGLPDRRPRLHVYKLKKPVKYPFLDFSTLRRRRFFCEEELRLNCRLANETYRDVVPLRCGRAGRLTLSDRGRIIEWLVEMKRLPLADMLDARLDRGIATRGDVRRIGERMAGFYAACAPEVAEGLAALLTIGIALFAFRCDGSANF
jgi:hypothetical protein